jgi:UDP-GlcNAc:undecaprenyl-phosphate/decaprenyl-phosphate GlcNAc-1-phosphate transferase
MPELLRPLLMVALLLPISLFLTRLMIRVAPRLGLVDLPGERRIHQTPIPRAGGIAVFLTMAGGMLLLHTTGLGFIGSLGGVWIWHFLAGASLLVGVGIWDDRRGISAWHKLGAQIAAATIMFFHAPLNAGMFMSVEVPWLIDLGIHVVWTVALINAFNLIDGMDGLCAGLGMISLAILAALALAGDQAANAWVIAVMAVALLGFLRYNFHPARIFLGDAGSMLVGFFIASAGTATTGRRAVLAGILLPLLVGGVPLLDVALAIWRRTVRRLTASRPGKAAVRIFGADSEHLHHRLLHWGFSQRQAVFIIYGFASVISLLALLPILGGANFTSVSVVGVVLIGLVGLRYIAPVELIESGKGLRALVRKPRSCGQTAIAYFSYDVVALFSSALLAWWIVSKAMVATFRWEQAMTVSMIFTFCTVVALGLARAHLRRWTRASSHDFAECAIWLVCGAGISFAILGMSQADFSFRDTAFHLAAIALGTGLVALPRCIGLVLQEGVIDTMHRKRRMKTKRSASTVLMYGAGDLGELFVCYLRLSSPDRWANHHFVGFIDDSRELHGRRMRGFPILGSLRQLPKLIESTGANSILITSTRISESRMNELTRAALAHGLEVNHWQPSLEPECLIEGEQPPAASKDTAPASTPSVSRPTRPAPTSPAPA